MTIRIHGNGAGAHALAWKLAESRLCSKIICTPGNAGTQTLCENLPASGYAADLEIPQTQPLCQTASESPEGRYTDMCVLSDGMNRHCFPPVHIEAGGTRLSCQIPQTSEPGFGQPDLSGYIQYFDKPGIYTFRFAETNPHLLQIFKGLPDATACVVLPSLQFDLIRILQIMASGFPEGFRLPLREGGIAVARVDGRPGAILENLSLLSGDIGVFLHQMENTDRKLRFTGPHGLYLCAREKTVPLALEKVLTAHNLLHSSLQTL